ncbi:MAG: amino acid ABC transporter permease [Desulfobacteraceae bacterium]|nr:amino acid ABC transporter permease [Desulfobacteraceae bacterium]
MIESFNAVKQSLPYLLQGGWITIVIVTGAMIMGFFMGLCMAVGQVYGPSVLKRVIGVYIWFFQGIPTLVLLFLFYFGLFNYIGFNINALAAVTVVLGMTTAAYQANIFKGAILLLPRGQFKAASTMGMSDFQAITGVILPQILRLSIPAWSNEFSIVLKDSALAFVLGVPEIMARAKFIASRTYQYLPLYIIAGLIYFVLTWAGVMGLAKLAKTVRIPGYANKGI